MIRIGASIVSVMLRNTQPVVVNWPAAHAHAVKRAIGVALTPPLLYRHQNGTPATPRPNCLPASLQKLVEHPFNNKKAKQIWEISAWRRWYRLLNFNKFPFLHHSLF